jgi:hypothetical protein
MAQKPTPSDPNKFDFVNHQLRVGTTFDHLIGTTKTDTVTLSDGKNDVILNADDHDAHDTYTAAGYKLSKGKFAPRKDARDPALIAAEEKAAFFQTELIKLSARIETMEKAKK